MSLDIVILNTADNNPDRVANLVAKSGNGTCVVYADWDGEARAYKITHTGKAMARKLKVGATFPNLKTCMDAIQAAAI